ncbi:MAG: TlpA family protein disulfide reductase [Alphaproteobacteria bacterium]|nr:TlpA family protein disulfide reductase [Alphaproteobacteria bacterium]
MLLEFDVRLVISKFLALGLGLTLAVSGCDKQSDGKPQGEAPQSSQQAPKEGLSGTVDRSHKGEDMPKVAFEDMAGKTVSLADFKGKPVLVNLWATWCGPCVAEMPTLESLATQRAGKLQVIAVSQDMKGRPAVAQWWNKQGFKSLTPYVDAKADLGFALGGGSLPTTIFYDAQGKEVWRMVGGAEWNTSAQLALIDASL